MLAMVAAVLPLLVSASPVDAALPAYVSAWRGELGEARRIAADLLARDPKDAGALFVAATVEIEDGRLDAAEELTARLAAVKPRAPEADVLRALVERRRGLPAERMDDALAEAWKAAGRPDLGAGGVLLRLWKSEPYAKLLPPVAPDAFGRLGPAEAFLLSRPRYLLESVRADGTLTTESPGELLKDAARQAEAISKEALALAGDPDSSSVGLNACLYAALYAYGGRDGSDARRRVGASLARALPDDGYVALALALDGTPDDQPLASAELDAVEAAARKPQFTWPRRAAYAEVLSAARRLDGARADLLARTAFGYACILPSLSPMQLPKRAVATKDPALRARAADAMDAVARRLAGSNMVLDWMIGVILRDSAASSRGDPGRETRRLHDRSEAWRERLAGAEARAVFQAWPLPSMWRDWDPDREIELAERLAGERP